MKAVLLMQPYKKDSSDSKVVSTVRPSTVRKKSISPPKNQSNLTGTNSDEKENRSQLPTCIQATSNEALTVKKYESKASFDHSTEDKSAEDAAKRRTKISAAVRSIPDIPKTFFSVVEVPYKLSAKDKEPEVLLSSSMVVRCFTNKNSCLFPYLLVGDQILEVNGHPVMSIEEFVISVFLQSKGTIRLIRPWNNTHCGDRLPTKRSRETSYLIVDFYKLPDMMNGFEIARLDKRPEVTSITTGQRGPHAFLVKDRILDIDSTPVHQFPTTQDLRRRFTRTLTKRHVCSFLVERALGLRSSPNTSLAAMRALSSQPIEMGDDACEIGAREATRIKTMADRYYIRPILKGETSNNTTATNTKSDEEPFGGVKKMRRGRKKNRKTVSIEGRHTYRVPSDVRSDLKLQKVTAKSGIIGFVRNYLSRN